MTLHTCPALGVLLRLYQPCNKFTTWRCFSYLSNHVDLPMFPTHGGVLNVHAPCELVHILNPWRFFRFAQINMSLRISLAPVKFPPIRQSLLRFLNSGGWFRLPTAILIVLIFLPRIESHDSRHSAKHFWFPQPREMLPKHMNYADFPKPFAFPRFTQPMGTSPTSPDQTCFRNPHILRILLQRRYTLHTFSARHVRFPWPSVNFLASTALNHFPSASMLTICSGFVNLCGVFYVSSNQQRPVFHTPQHFYCLPPSPKMHLATPPTRCSRTGVLSFATLML